MNLRLSPGWLSILSAAGALLLAVLYMPLWTSGEIIINWHTTSEVDLAGYNVYREVESSGEFVRVNPQLIDAHYDPLTGGWYTLIDDQVEPGDRVKYQLELVDIYNRTERQHLLETRVDEKNGVELVITIFFLGLGLFSVTDRLRKTVLSIRNWRLLLISIVVVMMLTASALYEVARASVVLSYFIATPSQSAVLLEWETVTEIDVDGFFINRSLSQDDGYQRVNTQIILALGDPLLGRPYSFNDQTVINDIRYYYRLEVVDADDNSTYFGPVEVIAGLNATMTPTSSPTRTSTVPAQRTPTRTSTPIPPTRIVTSTHTPTPTSTYTITPIPEPTNTPTPDLFDLPTITPVVSATETLVVMSTPTVTSSPTFVITETDPTDPWPVSARDWGRVGLLILVLSLWILLGAWLYYYLTRIRA